MKMLKLLTPYAVTGEKSPFHQQSGCECKRLITSVIIKHGPSPHRAMLRSLAILAISLSACYVGPAQSNNDDLRLRATVQAAVPLTRFSGTMIPDSL